MTTTPDAPPRMDIRWAGDSLDPAWPPLAGWWPDSARLLVEELDQAVLRRQAAHRAAADATEALKRAADDDVLAAAQAMRAGKPDPGAKHTTAAQRRLDDAKRKAAATDLVVASLIRETADAVRGTADEWRQHLDAEAEQARTDLHTALDAVYDAAQRLTVTVTTGRFVEDVQRNGSLWWKPAQPSIGGTPLGTVLAPLRRLADGTQS